MNYTVDGSYTLNIYGGRCIYYGDTHEILAIWAVQVEGISTARKLLDQIVDHFSSLVTGELCEHFGYT